LQHLGSVTEASAVAAWDGKGDSGPDQPGTIKVPKLALGAVNIDDLTAKLSAAVGPTNTVPSDQNPYWPNSNVAWANEFSRRAANVLNSAISQAFAPLPAAFQTSLSQITGQIEQVLAGYAHQIASIPTAVTKRTQLLWWKEARYSPMLDRSYRTLQPCHAAVQMAVDLYSQVLELTPVSVEYFLREAVLALIPENPSFTLKVLQDDIAAFEFRNRLNASIPKRDVDIGRRTVIEVITDVAQAKGISSDLRWWTGLPEQTELVASDWAVWIFRELQSLRLCRAEEA
jgi:hypothetical protein